MIRCRSALDRALFAVVYHLLDPVQVKRLLSVGVTHSEAGSDIDLRCVACGHVIALWGEPE